MRRPWLDAVTGLDNRLAPSTRWLWAETLLLTLAALVLSAWSNPADPLRVQGGFPWPLLGPVLAGLRYGFAAGFASALLVLATLGVAITRGWQPAEAFPLAWSTGVIAVAMLCGEFRDAWGRRLRQLGGANAYRTERLEEFTRSYHLLRVSHDRLEQALAGSGQSLREALSTLHRQLLPGQPLSAETGQRLLELLASYGSLQQAAIFSVDAGGNRAGTALAQWGTLAELDPHDPLLKQALLRGELAAVNAEQSQLEAARHSKLLAVVPLIDADGRVHAVLAIAAMPFFAFQHSTLTLLAVLCAHAADLLAGANEPGSDQTFARQLARAVRDSERFALPATLLQFRLPAEANRWRTIARRERRALDVWRERGDELIVLLPLTDRGGAEQWLQRLQQAGAPAVEASIQALDNASAARALLPAVVAADTR